MKTNASSFLAIDRALANLRAHVEKLNKQRERSMVERLEVQRVLATEILPLCQASGLTVSAALISKFSQQLSDAGLQMKAPAILLNLQTVETVVTTEVDQRVFLQIPPDMQAYYTQGDPLFGAIVSEAFPSAAYDISEAGKCLALERSTACVFHLMRAMEVCLLAFAESIGVGTSNNPSWGALLEKMEVKVKKDDDFAKEALLLLRSFKNAWRNPTMHMEKTFTQEVAQAIFVATKGFMNHISKKLKQDRGNDGRESLIPIRR